VAFFFSRSDDDVFVPSAHTTGPWNDTSQHGGPPSALLGWCIERAPGGEGKQLARIVLDILRPVPIEPLRVSVEVVRPGKRVDLVEASLWTEDTEVMRASAWRIIRNELDPGYEAPVTIPPTLTDAVPAHTFPPPSDPNYLTSMEWMMTSNDFAKPGPAAGWMRMKHPLIEGEENTPLVRVLTLVDSASGISAVLDWNKWLFINVDLTVHLHRYPQGEWLHMDAETTPQPSGIGLATSTISDEQGRLGVTAQSLLLAPR
jgi:hypothetical protein